MPRLRNTKLHQRIPGVFNFLIKSLARDFGATERLRGVRGIDNKIEALRDSLSQLSDQNEEKSSRPPGGIDLECAWGQYLDKESVELLISNGVSSVGEAYIKTFPVLRELDSRKWGIYFRGQQNIAWDICPSLARYLGNDFDRIPDLGPLEEELVILKEFQQKWPHLPEIEPEDRQKDISDDSCEWWFRMQHYGVPTRFLDITTSLNSALMFSCIDWDSGTIDDKQDGVIFCFAPNCGANLAMGNFTVESIFRYHGKYPTTIKNPPHNERSKAQNGAFMWWNEFSKPPDMQYYFLRIPKESKRRIVEELLYLGVGPANIVRGEKGIKNEVSLRHSIGFPLEYVVNI